jgi:NAD(P)-dependent dehydrogenase (short-subunit alcohol dehydrogenase family)
MRIVLAGRSVDDLESTRDAIAAASGVSSVVVTDVREPGDVKTLVELTRDEFGRIDVLCANSGVAGPTRALVDIDYQEWLDTFAVNVGGVFLCCRAAIPSMIARGGGSIVVIGSITGRRPLPRRTPYAASKTALIGLVRTLAMEVGSSGIRVNLVSPGPVAGPRLDRVIAAQAEALGMTPDAVAARMLAAQALPRFVEAAEVADTVAYLAGDRASAITGQDVLVSCGGLMT